MTVHSWMPILICICCIDCFMAKVSMQAMTGRLLAVAQDISGARERAALPSNLPTGSVKQV